MVYNYHMQKDQSGQVEQEQQIVEVFSLQPQPLKCSDDRFDSYIDELKQKGIIIHPSIKCGIFQLKNGLKYPGLYTQQNLQSKGDKQTILATIPVSLLLTAYHAQHNCAQQLKQLYNKQQYYHSGLIWQNRILVTYMLYNLDKNKDDIWSKMGFHFSKDIDIAQFWCPEDLNQFADSSVMRAALSQKESFDREWKEFQKVKIKNPILCTELFSYQNYKWVYTHVVSRCFGSYMNSSFFTPFCQFFNHNCVDVSFCCVEEEQYLKMTNESNQEEVSQSFQHQSQESIKSISECSGDSQQYIQQDDFSYEKVTTYNIKWYSKIGLNLKQKQTAQILDAQSKVFQFLDRQLKWIGFSLLYIGEILEKNNLIVNEYMAERKKFLMAKQQLHFLLYHAGQFLRKVRQYYKALGSTYMKDKDKFNKVPILNEKKQIQKQPVSNESLKKQEQKSYEQAKSKKTTKAPQKPYKYFTMVCHAGQRFQKRNEVYFEYGRLSNRTLLLCYGFCLQNNIYEHVWIHRNLAKQIGQYPDLFNKIQQKGLPITFNIKLKPYVLNTQLITLQKVEKWKIYGSVSQSNVKDFDKMFGIEDLQNQHEIINKIIQLYKQEAIKYELKDKKFTKLKNGLFDIEDRGLSYHDYFTAVYHNEKIKIIRLQILMLKKVCKIFKTILSRGIQIKGNSKLKEEIKKITMEQMGNPKLTRAVWGYIKILVTSIIS